MTISKEERSEWREKHGNGNMPFNFGHRIIRILDALEQAEAERDALAEKFADVSDKMNRTPSPRSFCHACDICPADTDSEMEGVTCEVKVLEWARQQARGGENA